MNISSLLPPDASSKKQQLLDSIPPAFMLFSLIASLFPKNEKLAKAVLIAAPIVAVAHTVLSSENPVALSDAIHRIGNNELLMVDNRL